jgi:hypothetical protein
MIQNNVYNTEKEDDLEDAELHDIADHNIIRQKERLIKVKLSFIMNTFQTFQLFL